MPMGRHIEMSLEIFGAARAPVACQMLGNAAKEHMQKYGKSSVQQRLYDYIEHDVDLAQ